ncbi:vomeronasal type-2 receptor 26-like [Discoglossus pictus]
MPCMCIVSEGRIESEAHTRAGAPSCNLNTIKFLEEYQYYKEGDIIIGAVLTVNSEISEFKSEYMDEEEIMCLWPFIAYYKILLSFQFAIEEINKDPNILSNVTLGYHIYDSCGDSRKSLKSVIQILSGQRTAVPNYSCTGHGRLAGVIGDWSSDNCYKCSSNMWPAENKDQCVPKVTEFLSYTNDIMVILFSIMSVSFAAITVFIFGIFIHYHHTPIVKANNKNLSFLLLVSILLSYLCVFLFIGRPVNITCMLRHTSFGIFFSVAVSSLVAKTIMVGIAFKATKPGSSWGKWVGVKLSNFVVIILSSIQGINCVSWLVISPPFQDFDMYSIPGKVIIQCNEGSVLALCFVLGYLGLLVIVSFITAFYTRKLPESFNESKFITFSMLVFISVWISMIPAYLSTKGKQIVTVEIFSILASNTGLLSCIFFPKCYVILFRPETNTKSHLIKKLNT